MVAKNSSNDKSNKIKHFFQLLINHYTESSIGDQAVVLAFYSVLSLFPILFISGSVLKFFRLNVIHIMAYIEPIFPDRIYSILGPIIRSTINDGGTTQLSFGILIIIWSASRAVAAFQRTINRAYGVAVDQTAVSNRLVSFLIMILLIFFIAAILILFIFGQMVLDWLQPILKTPDSLRDLFSTVKWPITILGSWILMTLMYYVVPTAKVKFRYTWIGGLFTSLGFIILGQAFTLYLRYFARSINTYKTIGTFIALLFWLQFSSWVMLTGGILNATIQELRDGEIKAQSDALTTVVNRARRFGRQKNGQKKNG